MTESVPSKRSELVRESLLFQVKLLADGLRDFLLLPISLAATAIGLLRSGQNPEAEFNRVLDLGRQSERWINLFGTHEPIHEAGDAGSIDRLVTRTEEVVREQVKRGAVSAGASDAIERALNNLHDKVRLTARKPDQKPGSS